MFLARPGAEQLEFESHGSTIKAYLGRPAAPGTFPAVMLLHGGNGVTPASIRFAERLADESFVGVLIDWHSRVPDPADAELLGYIDDCASVLRTRDFVDAERLALAGFCRGGSLVYLALARCSWLKAGVAFHGLPFYSELTPQRPRHPYDALAEIHAPLLVLHGGADEAAPLSGVLRTAQRLEELGKQFSLKLYGGVGHAFTLPGGRWYDPHAAADAWVESVRFLRAQLDA